MFGSGVKGKASSICVFVIWSFSFFLTKFFANIQQTFGTDVGFWFFATCSLVSIVFIITMFPETKGKSLIEIQEKLSRGIVNDNEKIQQRKNGGDINFKTKKEAEVKIRSVC